MFPKLRELGFQIESLSHAMAILTVDFPEVERQLEEALAQATIPVEEIIAGGGGESKGTQRLRRALTAAGWRKHVFTVERRINGVPKECQSHEIDHVRTFSDGSRIALEIEWNNKDPFFDRDLENFKRLHADGAISVGFIITRSRSLQSRLGDIVRKFTEDRKIRSFEDVRQWGYEPTAAQREAIRRSMDRARPPLSFEEAFTKKFVADKFGSATTHWAKLEDRIRRGVGNPCPLVLIGLPDSIITFNEGKAALAEIGADDSAVRAVINLEFALTP